MLRRAERQQHPAVLDRVVFPVEVDLFDWRLVAALAAVLLLLFGLVWEED